MTVNSATPLRFYLPLGGAIPLAVMLALILVLAVAGMAGTRQFWAAAYVGVGIGLLACRDKYKYCAAVVRGASSPDGAVVIMAWIFASVLGAVVVAAGLVDGILWLGLTLDVTGSAFTLVTFVAAMLFSVSTGTSNGTVLALSPVMYPAGVVLGADPTFLALAILSGAAFGDNVAPISDTTIVSAGTQGATMKEVVRSRMPLAFAAAALTAILLFALGGSGDGAPDVTHEMIESAGPISLLLVVSLAVVVIGALLDRHIIESLLYGSVVAILIGIFIGNIELGDVFAAPDKRGDSTGLIQDAITGVVGAIVFVLLVMAAVQVLRESGLMDRLLAYFQRTVARSVRSTEFAIAGISILMSSIVTSNGAAILLVGPTIARRLGESFNLSPARRANLMDCGVCSVFYLFPWSIAVLVWHSAIESAAVSFGLESPPITASILAPYPWMLVLVLTFSIVTGWKRTVEPGQTEARSI